MIHSNNWCLNVNCEKAALKQMTNHPTNIMISFIIHTFSWYPPFLKLLPIPNFGTTSRSLIFSPPLDTWGKKARKKTYVKILLNYAPTFWLQATAIMIPLGKRVGITICTFIYTSTEKKATGKMQKSSSFLFPSSPPKSVQIKNQCLPRRWKLQCRKFFTNLR